jgi:long-chain acyl-CoA synthetase
MKPIWLSSYPPGVPFEVDVKAFRSVCGVFDTSVAKFGSRAAFVNMGTAISYREMDRLTRDFGAYLQSVLKLPQRARLALMMPNVLQYPIAIFGALRAGYTVVNCNPLYKPRELRHQLADSGAEAIVVMENFASVVEQVIASTDVRHVIVTRLGDMLRFPTGPIVDFAVRFVKKLVPAWHLWNKRMSARTTWRSCNTRAAPPEYRRARCSVTATSWRICSRHMPGCSRSWKRDVRS